MMIKYIFTWQYGSEMLVVFIVNALLLYSIRLYKKSAEKRPTPVAPAPAPIAPPPLPPSNASAKPIHISYFSSLLSNTFLMLAILVPLLLAVTTSLFGNNPLANYSTLLACITCLVCVLTVALWLNFSLPSLSSADGDHIAYDTPSKSAIVLIYGFTMAAIVLGGHFFLFESAPLTVSKEYQPSEMLIYRQRLSLDLSREEVEKLWGRPSIGSVTNKYHYVTPNSTVVIIFNPEGKMTSLTETRKGR